MREISELRLEAAMTLLREKGVVYIHKNSLSRKRVSQLIVEAQLPQFAGITADAVSRWLKEFGSLLIKKVPPISLGQRAEIAQKLKEMHMLLEEAQKRISHLQSLLAQ